MAVVNGGSDSAPNPNATVFFPSSVQLEDSSELGVDAVQNPSTADGDSLHLTVEDPVLPRAPIVEEGMGMFTIKVKYWDKTTKMAARNQVKAPRCANTKLIPRHRTIHQPR